VAGVDPAEARGNQYIIKRWNGSAWATVLIGTDSGNVSIPQNLIASWGVYSSSGYYVSGTKVVGDRGAAVANATNTTDVITQLNTLLSRLRTHGLIAT